MTARRGALGGEASVTPMTGRDLNEIVELEAATRLSRWGYDGYKVELERDDAVLLVARSTDEKNPVLIGFVAARVVIDELHINNVAVRAEHRRRGVGRALLAEAMRRGAGLGAGWVVLEVRAGNDAARTTYDRLGFEVVGRRRDYYSSPIEDAIVMSRKLRR